jgi:hypothetical protein
MSVMVEDISEVVVEVEDSQLVREANISETMDDSLKVVEAVSADPANITQTMDGVSS